MSSELLLTGVSKIYRGRGKEPVHAVKDLSLAVKPGEITALLGSSGCGKTSTLRMIAGFEEVTGGSIALDGTAIHSLPPARRRVAMAFEAYSLYPPLTIGENSPPFRSASHELKSQLKKLLIVRTMSDISCHSWASRKLKPTLYLSCMGAAGS